MIVCVYLGARLSVQLLGKYRIRKTSLSFIVSAFQARGIDVWKTWRYLRRELAGEWRYVMKLWIAVRAKATFEVRFDGNEREIRLPS